MTLIEEKDGAILVKPDEDIVASKSLKLKKELLALIKNGEKNLIIDLQHIEMLDSTGLGILISAQNSLLEEGGALEVINVTADILKLFKIMRLDKHFVVKGK